MNWLIAARTVQGLGGGSIVGIVHIISGDLISLDKRSRYGFVGAAVNNLVVNILTVSGELQQFVAPYSVASSQRLCLGDGTLHNLKPQLIDTGAFISTCRKSCRSSLTYRLGGFSFGILVFFLHLNPLKRANFREWLRSFDFAGALLIVGGMVLLLFGLARGGEGQYTWYTAKFEG
jgi:hypothetical protein